MAHANYDCCAICDVKLEYTGMYAKTKEEICGNCLQNLYNSGGFLKDEPIFTVEQLMEWMEAEEPEKVIDILEHIGFTKCICGDNNPVDKVYCRIKNKIS